MIIELGDLRCAVSEIFPGLHDGCLVKKNRKTKNKNTKCENQKEHERAGTLIHTSTGAQPNQRLYRKTKEGKKKRQRREEKQREENPG